MKRILIPFLALLLAAFSVTVRGDDAPAAAAVSMHHGFSPSSITIKVGQTVIWTNDDDRDHVIAAADGSFKSDNLKHGQTFEHQFSVAGKFPYSCTLHPRERGVVIVEK